MRNHIMKKNNLLILQIVLIRKTYQNEDMFPICSFTQFFWFCLVICSLSLALRLFPCHLEARIFCFVMTCHKLQRFLSFVKLAIFIYIVLRSGMTLYYNLTSFISQSTCVFPLFQTSRFALYLFHMTLRPRVKGLPLVGRGPLRSIKKISGEP